MRAILWARVSDPRRKEESDAAYWARVQQDVENQLLPLRAHAAKFGWEVVAEFTAEGTAWNKEPPEKEKLYELLRQGGVDLVAVWAVDRWTRGDHLDAALKIAELDRHHRVSFFSINESFLSTATLDPALRSILLQVFVWLAESESRRKSERVKAAVAAKRARAGNIGQDAKWGRGRIPRPAEVARILELHKEHPEWSLTKLGEAVGFSRSTVYRICRAAAGDAPPSVSKQ